MPAKYPTKFDHPKLAEAFDLLREGRMDRREFIRVAALLGASAASAYALVGLPAPAYRAKARCRSRRMIRRPRPAAFSRSRCRCRSWRIRRPISWVQMSNQARHTLEYLAMTGPDNITRPMLAESWTAYATT